MNQSHEEPVMRNAIVAIILICFSTGARSELVRGSFEQLKRDDDILARIADLSNESKANLENQIMAAVSIKINSSLFKVRNIVKEFEFQGRTLAKVSCIIFNKPCIAHLARVGDEWEIVILTTTEQGE